MSDNAIINDLPDGCRRASDDEAGWWYRLGPGLQVWITDEPAPVVLSRPAEVVGVIEIPSILENDAQPIGDYTTGVVEANAQFNIGDRVVPTKPDGYHIEGIIRALPGFQEFENGDPVPWYSIDFSCADDTIENLWLTADQFALAGAPVSADSDMDSPEPSTSPCASQGGATDLEPARWILTQEAFTLVMVLYTRMIKTDFQDERITRLHRRAVARHGRRVDAWKVVRNAIDEEAVCPDCGDPVAQVGTVCPACTEDNPAVAPAAAPAAPEWSTRETHCQHLSTCATSSCPACDPAPSPPYACPACETNAHRAAQCPDVALVKYGMGVWESFLEDKARFAKLIQWATAARLALMAESVAYYLSARWGHPITAYQVLQGWKTNS